MNPGEEFDVGSGVYVIRAVQVDPEDHFVQQRLLEVAPSEVASDLGGGYEVFGKDGAVHDSKVSRPSTPPLALVRSTMRRCSCDVVPETTSAKVPAVLPDQTSSA